MKKRKKWSSEEEEKLKNGIKKYGRDFSLIYRTLGFPGRSLAAVSAKGSRDLNFRNLQQVENFILNSDGVPTAIEKQRIKEGMKEYGNNWKEIKRVYGLSRSIKSLKKYGKLYFPVVYDLNLTKATASYMEDENDRMEEDVDLESTQDSTQENEGKGEENVDVYVEKHDNDAYQRPQHWGIAPGKGNVFVKIREGITIKRLQKSCHFYESTARLRCKKILLQLLVSFPFQMAGKVVNSLLPLFKKVLRTTGIDVEIALICHAPYEYAWANNRFVCKKMEFTSNLEIVEDFFQDILAHKFDLPWLLYNNYEMALLEASHLNWDKQVQHRHFIALFDGSRMPQVREYFMIDVFKCIRNLKDVTLHLLSPITSEGSKIALLQMDQFIPRLVYDVVAKSVKGYSNYSEIESIIQKIWRDIQFVIRQNSNNNRFLKILRGSSKSKKKVKAKKVSPQKTAPPQETELESVSDVVVDDFKVMNLCEPVNVNRKESCYSPTPFTQLSMNQDETDDDVEEVDELENHFPAPIELPEKRANSPLRPEIVYQPKKSMFQTQIQRNLPIVQREVFLPKEKPKPKLVVSEEVIPLLQEEPKPVIDNEMTVSTSGEIFSSPAEPPKPQQPTEIVKKEELGKVVVKEETVMEEPPKPVVIPRVKTIEEDDLVAPLRPTIPRKAKETTKTLGKRKRDLQAEEKSQRIALKKKDGEEDEEEEISYFPKKRRKKLEYLALW